jgi:CRISPR type I-E-associated protein CasB/Cse2
MSIAEAREVVHKIALEIASEHFPAGDRAALRKEQLGPAFWKVAVRHLEPAGLLMDGPYRDEAERRWAAILAGLARNPGLHARGRRLGTVLAEAEVAEARVLRLARAHGDSLYKTVRAVAQQLASSGLKVDWGDFADLITSDGAPWEDEVRRRMCRDFYRTTGRGSRFVQKEEKS